MAKKKTRTTPDKAPEKEPRPMPTSPELAICRVKETAVVSVEHEYSRRFGAGAVVDLAEKIADGVYLGDLVRKGCFERISPEEAERAMRESEPTNGEQAQPKRGNQ